MSAVIYMFHAIGELAANDWADPHYSYSQEKFIEFLETTGSILSVEELSSENRTSGHFVTFDDGHISNYWAGKYIAENGYGRADFFINPAKVGQDYYMNWQQIKELSDLGMSIQSHGLDHQYLSDLNNQDLIHQLKESKRLIEEQLNKRVTILAPPGGRYDSRTIKEAKILGYIKMTTSKPGKIRKLSKFTQPRISVMRDNSVKQLLSSEKAINIRNFSQGAKYSMLKMIKTVAGNERYEKIRWFILGDGK